MANEKMHFVSGLLLTLHAALLLGKEETNKIADRERNILRLITPLAKLYTAKMAVRGMSEILECFGGAGYIEDTGIPVMLRDAQVFPIWEGPTNVLSLDLLRVLQKPEAFAAYCEDIELRLKSCKASQVQSLVSVVEQQLSKLRDFMGRHTAQSQEAWQCGARDLAFSMSRLFSVSLLLEMADWAVEKLSEAEQIKILSMAKMWCAQDLVRLDSFNQTNRTVSQAVSLT